MEGFDVVVTRDEKVVLGQLGIKFLRHFYVIDDHKNVWRIFLFHGYHLNE